MPAKDSVEAKIAQGKRTVVFSKTYCPYCRQAKNLLKEVGEDFDVYELDTMDEGDDWQAYLGQKTGQRTVPSIFIGGKFVGGCSDLQAKHKSGELKTLLA
ncbi:thioredoxin-like protein [Rhodotorula diobovata]|uniref:glutathione peroxidase n=1 Tax=Rhodotorula diobovata TaxID=5288 RepID=A0A5C5G2Z6_9BASI|nr:thioredoxin-like protein [Rhodotorula diobovata]